MRCAIIILILLCARDAGAETEISRDSKRSIELISSADYVIIRRETDRAASGALIVDKNVIGKFAEAISKTQLTGSHQCFCTGWLTAYFYKDGKVVYSIAAIHGNQIRVYSEQSGGDFTVEAAQWNAMHDLIELTKTSSPLTMNPPPKHVTISENAERANQALLPTPMSVTPPAGQEARQP